MKSSPHPSRRHFLQTAGLTALGWPLASAVMSGANTAVAQTIAPGNAAPVLAPLNRFPRMMQEWLVDQVRAAEVRGNALRDAVKTKADAEAYVKSAQERIRESFGTLPEKTPLNAKMTRMTEREGYRIENIIFESRPNYMVTGNLYMPTRLDKQLGDGRASSEILTGQLARHIKLLQNIGLLVNCQ